VISDIVVNSDEVSLLNQLGARVHHARVGTGSPRAWA
jgi:hypothetical protein